MGKDQTIDTGASDIEHDFQSFCEKSCDIAENPENYDQIAFDISDSDSDDAAVELDILPNVDGEENPSLFRFFKFQILNLDVLVSALQNFDECNAIRSLYES